MTWVFYMLLRSHGGGTDTEIRVSTESWPWRRKFSSRSSRDSNPRPFDHESGALTTELSPPPLTMTCICVRSVTLRPATSTERLLRSVRAHVRGASLLRCDDDKVTITIPALQTGKLTGSFLHGHLSPRSPTVPNCSGRGEKFWSIYYAEPN